MKTEHQDQVSFLQKHFLIYEKKCTYCDKTFDTLPQVYDDVFSHMIAADDDMPMDIKIKAVESLQMTGEANDDDDDDDIVIIEDEVRPKLEKQANTCFTCVMCPYKSDSEKDIKNHLNLVHLDQLIVRKAFCEKCVDNNVATHDCKNCGQKICMDCVQIHQKWKDLQSHIITLLPESQK